MENELDLSQELSGRRALVTGGTRGIGLAIAQRLIDTGAKVVISARTPGDALPKGAHYVAGDVATVAGAKAIAKGTLEAHGGLDIFVNNAGGATGFPQGSATIPDEEWEACLALNLLAADKNFPEIDFTYFITPNIAAELILTYPQKHDIKFGRVKIGDAKHLPPTLTLQYHFLPEGTVRPYVGAGINYTRFMSVHINAQPAVGINSPIDIDRNSFGLAGQAGVDFKVADNWFVNLDAKYVKIEAKDVRITGGALAGTKVTDLKIDPWLLSVGVGYRF